MCPLSGKQALPGIIPITISAKARLVRKEQLRSEGDEILRPTGRMYSMS